MPTGIRGGFLQPGRSRRNWSRSAQSNPALLSRPRTAEEVVETIRVARERGLPVKAIGAGHSFTSIAMTDGVLVDVSAIDGVLAVDATRGRVRLGAGTNLWQLPELLAPHGLALQNMGDIDRQTVAGATSTGTHGTGLGFGGLATQITAATLVTADGGLLRVSEDENAELLPAVRLALGALGILVELEIQCVPAYLLHAVEHPAPFDETLDRWGELVRGADHFEFYWWPHTDTVMTKSNTRLPLDTPYEPESRFKNWVEKRFLENGALRASLFTGWVAPAVAPSLNRLATRLYGDREWTAPSIEVFTSPRLVPFRESEYAIPLAALPDVLREIRSLIDREGWRISFPVEVRAAAADENWLSTAYRRETAYVAVHRYWRDDPRGYFAAVEAIARGHGGRPHWGKMHERTADDLVPVYPRLGDFLEVRDRLDPERVFANDYTRRVLGA